MAGRLPPVEIVVVPEFPDDDATSRWFLTEEAELLVAVACRELMSHELAMEILTCLGQALWDEISENEVGAWLTVLHAEIEAGVTGEIDEAALAKKRKLLANETSVRSRRRLAEFARASFAGTAAEYVHALWHDVTVCIGPEYLAPDPLRKRLELMHRWFPPDRGYRLFPKKGVRDERSDCQ